MSETQERLRIATERFNARNMFVDGVGMVESNDNMHAMFLAQEACWEAGECCGCLRDDGKCGSRWVVVSRNMQLLDAGMAKWDAWKLSDYCEFSPQYSELASVYEFAENEQGQALAGRLWAIRFLQLYGSGEHVDGISESGQDEAGEGTGDDDGIGKGDDAGAHQGSARAD